MSVEILDFEAAKAEIARLSAELEETRTDFNQVLTEVGVLSTQLKLTQLNDTASLFRKLPVIIVTLKKRENIDRLFVLAAYYTKFNAKYGKAITKN